MNGHILSCTSVVRVPYNGIGRIDVVAEGTPSANDYAYTYNGDGEQVIGSYSAAGGNAHASLIITGTNETTAPITVVETIYSFWNGDVAGSASVTIIYEPRRQGQPL